MGSSEWLLGHSTTFKALCPLSPDQAFFLFLLLRREFVAYLKHLLAVLLFTSILFLKIHGISFH